jgi:hypothetical protein
MSGTVAGEKAELIKPLDEPSRSVEKDESSAACDGILASRAEIGSQDYTKRGP